MSEILQTTPRGLYCPAGGFYIDPSRSVDRPDLHPRSAVEKGVQAYRTAGVTLPKTTYVGAQPIDAHWQNREVEDDYHLNDEGSRRQMDQLNPLGGSDGCSVTNVEQPFSEE